MARLIYMNIFSKVLLNASFYLAMVCLILPQTLQAGEQKWIAKADLAVMDGKYGEAEQYFAEALKADPESPRILRGLAETKIALKKYQEAKLLIDKILAMSPSNGRDVLVFFKGESQGLEAELVDELVTSPPRTNDNMRNYLDNKGNDPIPHYRLFFKRKGKMELVPQKAVRIKYQGVPRRVYEHIEELNREVNRHLIAAQGSRKPAEMVALKGGCFRMGSAEGMPVEQPVHEVCLSPFKIDKFEVTQAEFQSIMGLDNPSHYSGADLPVDSATWFEAERYCKKLGKRLPTEAEWEFAARGGTTTTFYWGNTVKGKEANFCDKNCVMNTRVESIEDGYAGTAPPGKFPANPHGLYDMAGNLAEWTNDWMDENYYRNSPKDNPPGSHPATAKVVRGGSWESTAGFLRSSNRAAYWPKMRNNAIGFRCVSSS
ncbi:MAG: SUMF1/EgtB/PvdO family nonheme iron enzyme [Nitrospinae bacterium]|nr:SUMF1/EgtB/PvdO family nonheme iron enzyme [Nitrospinota bacterium]